MIDKVCVVTGANSGIGYALAKGLLLSGAQVILACRNPVKAEQAKERLIRETKSSKLDIILCDLSLKSSVKKFVQEFNHKYKTLDVLCQCAGNISFKRTLTDEGIEANFASNVLGPFYLSKLLLPYFTKDKPVQIINIAGEFHRFYKIDFDNVFYQKNFNPLMAGSISMLERIMLTYYLADKVKDTNIAVNCFHPENVKTEMLNKLPSFVRPFASLIKPFQISPEEGADTALWLATTGSNTQKITGKYFIKRKMVNSSAFSYDKMAQQKLNDLCEQLLAEGS